MCKYFIIGGLVGNFFEGNKREFFNYLKERNKYIFLFLFLSSLLLFLRHVLCLFKQHSVSNNHYLLLLYFYFNFVCFVHFWQCHFARCTWNNINKYFIVPVCVCVLCAFSYFYLLWISIVAFPYFPTSPLCVAPFRYGHDTARSYNYFRFALTKKYATCTWI